jgi:hypothetical protein
MIVTVAGIGIGMEIGIETVIGIAIMIGTVAITCRPSIVSPVI